ncbi:hypothetical protein MMC17_007962 [Xylographa soralifera]|nr:hypothetical protein [Xylographa soralifera]
MKSSTLLSILLAVLPTFSSATFSLNVSGPDWNYTSTALTNTTSQACRDAYSASIECDPTLLGLVASMRPSFAPTAADLDATCTRTCKSSLDAYVQNVAAVCSKPGDQAKESLGGACCQYTTQPVQLVGQIFQYHFATACSKDSEGDYCYLSESESDDATPADVCTEECVADFYQAAHDFTASGWEFNYYYLVSQSAWWINQFTEGWTALQSCPEGEVPNPSAEPTDDGLYPTAYPTDYSGYTTCTDDDATATDDGSFSTAYPTDDSGYTTCTDNGAALTETAFCGTGYTTGTVDGFTTAKMTPTFTLPPSQTIVITAASQFATGGSSRRIPALCPLSLVLIGFIGLLSA